MKDDLNIRKLYENIIEERASHRGVILMENVNIPANNSSPDQLNFEEQKISYESGYAFSFIGERKTLLYTDETHPYIFNALNKIDDYPKEAKSWMKKYYVKSCDTLSLDDVKYFFDNQKTQTMGETRIKTFSGRIWKSVKSKLANKEVSVIAFWGNTSDITGDYLKKIKKCFKLGDIFWVAMDSSKFNYYGDDYIESSDGEVKKLKSRIYPELAHEDIVDILMRAHSNYKMSPFEKKIVWEFRGFDPSEIKNITGGYPSKAEYEYRKKLSENVESIFID